MQGPAGRRVPALRDAPEDVPDDAPRLDHHALGPAGRAGGVDHVHRVAGARAVRRRRRRQRGPRLLRVEPHHLCAVRRQPILEVRLHEDHPGPRILQHEREPLGRIGRVERHVRAAGFQHGEQRHHQGRRPFGAHPHPLVWPDTEAPQVVREAIGARAELRVRQPRVVLLDRDRVRRRPGVLLEQILDAPIQRSRESSVVPGRELRSLRVRQQRQLRQARVRVVRGVRGQRHEVVEQPLHRPALHAGRVVGGLDEGPLREVAQRQPERLLRREHPVEHHLGQQRPPRRPGLRGIFFRGEAHVVERSVPGASRRALILHHHVEGQRLVEVGVHRRAPRSAEDLAERRIAPEIGPEHDRVGAGAHEPEGPGRSPVGGHRAEPEVCLPAVTRQHRGEGSVVRDVGRAAGLPAERP